MCNEYLIVKYHIWEFGSECITNIWQWNSRSSNLELRISNGSKIIAETECECLKTPNNCVKSHLNAGCIMND